MVRKMTGPDAVSANVLARQVGVSQSALSRWLRLAGERAVCVSGNCKGAVSLSKARRPEDWSPEEKYQAVLKAESLCDEELGAFLRQKGLHEAQLKEWREQIFSALTVRASKRTAKGSSEKRQIRQLEKELERKEKALAEAAALLVLQKKAQILFGGDEAEPTPKKNGK